MLGIRGGSALRDIPAHHGVDLTRNVARQAREAAALLEAALLLDPESIDLRADAITAIQWYTDQNWHYPDHDVERLRRAMRAHQRGLEHLEMLVNLGGDLRAIGTVPGGTRASMSGCGG